MTPAIAVQDFSLAFGERTLFDAFSLTAARGEAVLLRGPSGAGKTTLLHAICGLIPAEEMRGTVLLFGRDVRALSRIERARAISIAFQNPETQLFCGTVQDEIAFGLENLLMRREDMAPIVEAALQRTGLAHLRGAPPATLSGGQKQLLVLAAVLSMGSDIILLDEATSQLSQESRANVLAWLFELKRAGTTLLIVEHSQALAPLIDRTLDVGV